MWRRSTPSPPDTPLPGIEFGWRVHLAIQEWTKSVDQKASIFLVFCVALAALDAYVIALATAPLAAQTRRTYASKVRQYLAWLASAETDGDPINTRDGRGSFDEQGNIIITGDHMRKVGGR